MKNKIIAVIKHQNNDHLVLKYKPKLIFKKYDDVIIGSDGIFLSCYYYYENGSKAFAGQKFNINLNNREVVHCNGNWWGGLTTKTKEIIGKEITHVIADSLDNLESCYIYSGYFAIKKKIIKLRRKYKDKIYGYKEYEQMLKNKKPIH